jgi:hypothetical protein
VDGIGYDVVSYQLFLVGSHPLIWTSVTNLIILYVVKIDLLSLSVPGF